SASGHVNQIWEKISDWWCSKKVQEARLSFCDKYARKVQNPISTLRKILLDGSSKLGSG
ncbi:hypothetical protein LEP1GSC170_0247, partial [Leptospira interrogans serovar Bataviae str. HAI135]